jgi:hypothetical protein
VLRETTSRGLWLAHHKATQCVCVFITAVPITKLFELGGKQWRTCATRDYELRPVSAHHALVNAGGRDIV